MLTEPKPETKVKKEAEIEEFKRLLIELLQNDIQIRDLLTSLLDKEKRTRLFI